MGSLPSPFAILVGIGAGLASALGFAALSAGTSVAFLLFLVSALPVVIACLGWGTGAGIVAVLADAAIIAALHTPASAFAHVVLSPLPALVLCHAIGLARPDPATGAAHWYPLGRVLVLAALTVAAGCLVTGWLADLADEGQMVALARQLVAGPGPDAAATTVDPQVVEALARMLQRLLPLVTPSVWCGIILANLWAGAHIARLSDRLARPWEPLEAVVLPRLATVALVVLLALALMGGTLGLIASPFAGAFGTLHVLAGLAFLHKATAGNLLRGFILSIAWASLILTLPALILMAVGIVDTVFNLRGRMNRPRGPTS